MPKRIKQRNRPSDLNQWAHALVAGSTHAEEDGLAARLPTKDQISRLMAAMGRKGGKIGGKRRMTTMTPAARRRVARKAAKARWAGKESAT